MEINQEDKFSEIESGIAGVKVYKLDHLPERLTDSLYSSIVPNGVYKIIGIANVAAVEANPEKKIRARVAWDGILVEKVETKKRFVVGVNTILGMTMVKNSDTDKWEQRYVSARAFDGIDEVIKHINKFILAASKPELLESQKFDNGMQTDETERVKRFTFVKFDKAEDALKAKSERMKSAVIETAESVAA